MQAVFLSGQNDEFYLPGEPFWGVGWAVVGGDGSEIQLSRRRALIGGAAAGYGL